MANVKGWNTLAALLASTTALAVGEIVTAEGWLYKVAPTSATNHHLSTAGGFKLYVLPDGHVYNFKAFGPKADGVTDDYAKLMKAINAASSPLGSATGPALYFPDAAYFIGQTVELKKAVKLVGHASGQSWDSRALLKFPANTAGIVINRDNTLGGAIVSPTTGADCTIIEGLRIVGSGGADQSKAGIWMRARAIIKNCFVQGFSGDGIKIVADVFGGDTLMGNANCWQVLHTSSNGNGRHGIYTQAGDVNAGLCMGCDFSYNGRFGVYDDSFLGNTYVGIHVDSNGIPNSGQNGQRSSTVAHGGKRYAAHPSATPAQMAATTPGTNASVWVHIGDPNAHSVAWQQGGTYFAGGGYWAAGASQRNVFLGCYEESGSAGHYFGGRNIVLGGLMSESIAGGQVSASGGNHIQVESVSIPGVSLGGDTPNGDILRWGGDFRLRSKGKDYVIDHANLDARQIAYITGPDTTAPWPFVMGFESVGIGMRRHTSGSAPPASGSYIQGEIVWNDTPSSGGSAGWICTVSGSPGTWRPFGAIG